MLSQEMDGAGPSRLGPVMGHDTKKSTEETNSVLGGTEQEEEAALMIQKHYRGHKSRQQSPHPKL